MNYFISMKKMVIVRQELRQTNVEKNTPKSQKAGILRYNMATCMNSKSSLTINAPKMPFHPWSNIRKTHQEP